MAHKATRKRSARHGRAPAPYTKYKKAPFPYAVMYKRLREAGNTPLARHLKMRG